MFRVRFQSAQRPIRILDRSFQSSLPRKDHFIKASKETFHKAISNRQKIVLVDFYADWCAPCKMLSPILDEATKDPAARSGSGKAIDLVTVDTDEEAALAEHYQVRAMPTVIAFKDGQPVDRFVGALNEPGVRAFLAKV